jgi:hypothetical protein
MLQPDVDGSFDELSVVRREEESHDQFLSRKRDARIYSGRIDAIKLTGDPNIPRGECTFYAEDIGEAGFLRTAHEEPFEGARVVRSLGHIAEPNFSHGNFPFSVSKKDSIGVMDVLLIDIDTYTHSELFMISPDRFAQYWISLGHISYYERVRIDDFISPRHEIRSMS